MKLSGPYLTLGGGLALAAVLVGLSVSATGKEAEIAAVGAVTAPVAQDAKGKGAGGDGGAAAAGAAEDRGKDGAGSDAGREEVATLTPDGTYAGRVKGGGASLAVVVKGDTAIAYLCDGRKVEAWMQGPSDGTPLRLKGDEGESLRAEYDDTSLSGTVRARGRSWSFDVKAVKAPSGLYRAARQVRNAKVVGGWIIVGDEQVGMLRRPETGQEGPAPEIDLATGTATVDGVRLPAARLDASAGLDASSEK